MAPIVSPRLLSQILMRGCAAEICTARYVKVAAVESRAQPVAVPSLKEVTLGSVAPRKARLLGPTLTEASCTPLPNATFVLDSEEVAVEVETDTSKVPPDETHAPASALSLADEDLAPLAQNVDAPTSLAATLTRRSSLSTLDSTTSCSLIFAPISCNPPSTTASSVPLWVEELFRDPAEGFGAPSSTYTPSRLPSLDSLRVARPSLASEAAVAIPVASRAHKVSDVRGLKRFGLRRLQLFKKLKW